MPLILPVHLLCNTSDEELRANVFKNSREHDDWQRLEDAHSGVAVICGSGPSLADTLDEIWDLYNRGGTVFALNGAAKYLADQGILPDYQVILDARKETADLVGPAKEHLFASQVHPECFARAPKAKLWQLQIGDIDELLPPYERSYVLIGGAASVGNTAGCLAFAKGFRDLHYFGVDSSNRGEATHAFDQPLNAGEPQASVTFNGKEYTASLTMKLQAERFMLTAQALKEQGCKIEVHGSGLLPDMWRAPPEVLSEAQKYERLWGFEGYREFSPGEECVELFLSLVEKGSTIADLGCGTGRAAIRLNMFGHPMILVDFAANCRDEAARYLPFVQADLRDPIPVRAHYGFCTDVMEHIATQEIEVVLHNIMQVAPKVFFQISTRPDEMGALIGEPLHLTVMPHAWWKEQFFKQGCFILYEREDEGSSIFYVSKGTANVNG